MYLLTPISRMLTASAVSFCLAIVPTGAGAEVESKDPIKLTLHDWTGQLITTQIMGEVLAERVLRGLYDMDTALAIIPTVFHDAPKEIYGL